MQLRGLLSVRIVEHLTIARYSVGRRVVGVVVVQSVPFSNLISTLSNSLCVASDLTEAGKERAGFSLDREVKNSWDCRVVFTDDRNRIRECGWILEYHAAWRTGSFPRSANW